MIRYIFLFLSLLLFKQAAIADGGPYFPDFSINVGVKIGYQWSTQSSFIWGIEASAVYNNRINSIYGVVLNMDKGEFGRKVHIGAQVSTLYGGAEIGPTFFTNKDGTKETGGTVSVFTGIFLYPNYSFSFTENDKIIHELDLLIKLPAYQYFKNR